MGEFKRIKVVWLCNFSNACVHEKLDLGFNWLIKNMRKLLHKPVSTDVSEFANWVTNGIREFEKIDEVELHIVSPYPHLKHNIQEFSLNGIHYHFYKNEDDVAWALFYDRIFRPRYRKYKRNRKIISSIIKRIQPDIVHVIGAENPYYSLAVLDVPENVITIAQLQTLMNDPDFKEHFPMDDLSYQYRSDVEREIIKKVDFIGTKADKFRRIILKDLRTDAIILNTTLHLGETIVKEEMKKEYDFVYFSANLDKAADLALEAFGMAFTQRPNITLDVIGGYDASFKEVLDGIIRRYGMKKAIRFEGNLPTHEDVLHQIRKSRFALLPLRIDLTSGTIREAMSNGLPVITTNTGELGTQKLNSVLQCALISEVGNHQGLADNIMRLLDDEKLADTLRSNAYIVRGAAQSNETVARHYVEAYRACLANKYHGIPISEDLTIANS